MITLSEGIARISHQHKIGRFAVDLRLRKPELAKAFGPDNRGHAFKLRQPLQLTHVTSLQSHQVLKIYHQVWQGERAWQEEESFGLIVLSVVPEQSL